MKFVSTVIKIALAGMIIGSIMAVASTGTRVTANSIDNTDLWGLVTLDSVKIDNNSSWTDSYRHTPLSDVRYIATFSGFGYDLWRMRGFDTEKIGYIDTNSTKQKPELFALKDGVMVVTKTQLFIVSDSCRQQPVNVQPNWKFSTKKYATKLDDDRKEGFLEHEDFWIVFTDKVAISFYTARDVCSWMNKLTP